ncbi:unnamed protein product [Camellia sinensis]
MGDPSLSSAAPSFIDEITQCATQDIESRFATTIENLPAHVLFLGSQGVVGSKSSREVPDASSGIVGNMKKMCGPTSDIITHLPDNVKEKILMSLPLQDAVRTSILSRKLRYMWARLPQLLFDDKFCRELIKNQKNKLVMTIYQVLLLHRGPILRFTLSLSGLEGCSEIDQLVLFVSNNGGVPKRLPITLSHLKIIDLYAICFGEVNEVCTHETTAIDHVLELLEIQDWSDVSLNQLREVEIRNLSGTRFELEFIKLLLAKSPMLETMLIEPDLEKVADKGLRILKELTRFWRSSPKAKITYNDPDGSRNENEPLKIKFSKCPPTSHATASATTAAAASSQEETVSSELPKPEHTDYAAMMSVIYSMVKLDYIMQKRVDGGRPSSASIFVGGFVLGGIVVGALGCIYAPQISKALAGVDRKDLMRKLPKFIYDEEKALERTRKILTEKIAQLNSAIDDVSSQLRADDTPNGTAVSPDKLQCIYQ